MPINCRTCKHYQNSIAAKYLTGEVGTMKPCTDCADFPHRRSFYDPINTGRFEAGFRETQADWMKG